MKLSCRYTNVLYYFVAYYKTILMISIMESTGGFSVHTHLSNKTIQVLGVDICVNCLVLHKITIVQEMLNLLEFDIFY